MVTAWCCWVAPVRLRRAMSPDTQALRPSSQQLVLVSSRPASSTMSFGFEERRLPLTLMCRFALQRRPHHRARQASSAATASTRRWGFQMRGIVIAWRPGLAALTREGLRNRQRSYFQIHPRHLLSRSVRCGLCGGAIGQVGERILVTGRAAKTSPPSESRTSRDLERRFDLMKLVEAVGIEPTSESPRRQASTSIADYLLLSLLGPPIGGISERPAPKVSSRTPEQGLGPVTRI